MTAYREPGREVDATAIETAKIHEAAETQRTLIQQREETKRKRVMEIGYAPHVLAGIVLVVLTISSTIVGYQWIDRKSPQCTESSYSKSAYGSLQCNHPLHILVQDEKTWSCKCGTPKLGGTQ